MKQYHVANKSIFGEWLKLSPLATRSLELLGSEWQYMHSTNLLSAF